jgi:hypothetical protein
MTSLVFNVLIMIMLILLITSALNTSPSTTAHPNTSLETFTNSKRLSTIPEPSTPDPTADYKPREDNLSIY